MTQGSLPHPPTSLSAELEQTPVWVLLRFRGSKDPIEATYQILWVPNGSPWSCPLSPASLPATGLPTYCPLHPPSRGCISDHTLGPLTTVQSREHWTGPCSMHIVGVTGKVPFFKIHLNSRTAIPLRETRPRLFLWRKPPRNGWWGSVLQYTQL